MAGSYTILQAEDVIRAADITLEKYSNVGLCSSFAINATRPLSVNIDNISDVRTLKRLAQAAKKGSGELSVTIDDFALIADAWDLLQPV